MWAEPLVASSHPLTALSDGSVTAIYDCERLSVSRAALEDPIRDEDDLNCLVSGLAAQFTRHSNPPTHTSGNSARRFTKAFSPLLDRRRTSALNRLTINISNACNLWCSY